VTPEEAAATIRDTERERIAALVSHDMETAEDLHAADFLLSAPSGEDFTKDEYLTEVGSGGLDYLLWEPLSPLRVRVNGEKAVVRYRSKIGLAGRGGTTTEQTHKDTYVLEDGRWRILRSVTVFDS
jgi:ketosteroid isomerase-like protein